MGAVKFCSLYMYILNIRQKFPASLSKKDRRQYVFWGRTESRQKKLSTVVFSFFVSGSGSDRCGSGSG